MPVDETWLAITKLYAIVAMLALLVVTAGLIHLGVKVRGLVKAGKLAPKLAAQQSKRTGDLLRRRGEAMVSRCRRLGPVWRSSFERIAAKLRETRNLIEP
jgi:hypothetical protein